MGAIMRFERTMGEVSYRIGALGRAFEHRCDRANGTLRQRVEVATQTCRLCGLAVECRYVDGDDAMSVDAICEVLARSYDDHECARLSSALYATNDGLDELYARIEALSVEMAARAIELAAAGEAAGLVARAEHESRELARRAKTLEWILERGVVSAP